jgi:DNA modification methylase
MTLDYVICGDALAELRKLPDELVHCCVTSPPYWGLRDYGVDGQLGLEPTPEEYVANLVAAFREVRRVLRDDGTLWLNLGDCYNGSGGAGGDYNPGGLKEGQPKYPGRNISSLKPKDLVGIPWRVAFALQADGWWLRSDIIWHKPNPMPESVTDRPTRAHEYIFLLSKSQHYYYDAQAIREPSSMPLPSSDTKNKRNERKQGRRDKQRGHGRRHAGFNERWDQMSKAEQCAMGRNKRSVWTVATRPFPEAHFATFPLQLIEPCILAGAPVGGLVLDPFAGSGTTAVAAKRLGRQWLGIELNPEYAEMARRRIDTVPYSLFSLEVSQ